MGIIKQKKIWCLVYSWASQVVLVVKNVPANAGEVRDVSSVGKIPWRRVCNPLQYSCLENLMNRGAWQAIVHRAAKNQTRLK